MGTNRTNPTEEQHIRVRPSELLWLAERKIDARVWIALVKHSQNGYCHPSFPKIAEYAGVSRRTVAREIEKLIAHGAIEKLPTINGEVNEYVLIQLGEEVTNEKPVKKQTQRKSTAEMREANRRKRNNKG